MRLLWIGGDHPRHLFVLNRIDCIFPVAGAVIEKRENFSPEVAPDLAEGDRRNFVRHFEGRREAERRYFGEQRVPTCSMLRVSREELNSNAVVDFVRTMDPDAVLIFGAGLVKTPLHEALPRNALNLHLGLSPRYRGAATLFWPFYFLEPGFAGSTFHYIVKEPDAGAVVHQVVPELSATDGIHDVACKTVLASAEEGIALLGILAERAELRSEPQRGTGKKFLASDFRVEHLRVIYGLFDDDIVKCYLDGQLRCQTPRLVRQF